MEKLVIKVGAIIAVVIILTIGSCISHSNYRISQAIKQGVDPIAARLAYEAESTDNGRATQS